MPGKPKGLPKTGGRQKGTPNKITRTVKENVIAVFDKIGGMDGMAEWAEANRTEFYRLYGRLIPLEVGMQPSRTVGDLTLDELTALAGSEGDSESNPAPADSSGSAVH